MLRSFFAVGWLVVTLFGASTTHAQSIAGPDFGGQVQTTLPSNEQLLGQINDTLPATDLGTITDQTSDTVAVARELSQQLTSAMGVAPDDASRARLEAVLNHTQAALESLQLVKNDTTVDAARGRLDQARGEVREGLDELRPFVLGLVASGVISGK